MKKSTFDLSKTLIDLLPLRNHSGCANILEDLKMACNGEYDRATPQKLMTIFEKETEENVFLGLNLEHDYVFFSFPVRKVVSIEEVLGEGVLSSTPHYATDQHWDGVSELKEGMIVGHHLSPDDSICVVKAFNDETVCITYGDNEIDLVEIDQIYSVKLRNQAKNLVSEWHETKETDLMSYELFAEWMIKQGHYNV